ncbi:hypothetical protein J0X19_21400 [Hymenobacter sp. BT186]|uniref:Uncharacterized protein n=1 Tax=Hymenobacter telluris TaxID=2816474 RepID=A0A939F1C0_9BACT|nr:hypothetical protein [Hymenobacter telluris]MBO0360532.1 hypothetical protein [Hymenobacter telluris]MBW3376559.1 hypothetical protein [Hymenobacter norwichensis]
MGFGFNLFFIFILLPLTLILVVAFFITWLSTGKTIFGKILGILWLFVLSLVILSMIARASLSTDIERDDIYGEYVIDRTKFPGKQADWQYNHFRFEITERNKLFFHVTEGINVTRTYSSEVSFTTSSRNPHIILYPTIPTHHIISDNPTLYTNTSEFYYVFHSPKFGNVFFKKGEWEPIED